MARRPKPVDVVIVGAGLSGLSAARELRAAGASCLVLEARDRVGGKMRSVEVAGVPVDLGAHWIGPQQRRVAALARELGIDSHRQHLAGENVLRGGDEKMTFSGTVPRVSLAPMLETGLAIARIERLRKRVNLEDPAATRGSTRLDATTLGAWMRPLRSRAARTTLELTARTVFGAEPDELSLLYFLWYVQSAGGFEPLTEFDGGAQDAHFPGGTQAICLALAAELGDSVVLDSPVRAIEQDGGVTAVTDKRSFRGRRLIFASSPAFTARVAWTPELPPSRHALAQRMPLGVYMKAVAVYERPWWRDDGLSGLGYSDTGALQMVVDASPPGGAPGVLMGFLTGAPALPWGALDEDGRRTAALEAIAALLGPAAREPIGYRDVDWTQDPWSRGGPVGLMGPGVLTGPGRTLRQPVGLVHWAGTDTATEWNGYMEGAIQAGRRAAREVVAEL
jgi:monoamine oxidase